MRVGRDNHLDQAWQIVFDLVHGGLGLAEVERRLEAAAGRALEARADALLRQLRRPGGEPDAALRAAFRSLAAPDAERLPFDAYRKTLESELAGVVITAHPTFAFSPPAADALLARIAAGATPGADGARARAEPDAAPPYPVHRARAPTLEEELDASTRALRHVRRALRRVLSVAVDAAAELYPERYRELDLRLVTLATWVGFDLDGRTDIGWSRSLSCRYALALAGLDELRSAVRDLRAHDAPQPAADALALIENSVDALLESFANVASALGEETADSVRLGRFNRLALESRALRRDAVAAIDRALEELRHAPLPFELAKDVVVLASEWRASGVGLARLHFRVNSVQLHNAIRPEISMLRAPGQSPSRRLYLAEISRLLDTVTPVNVHYGSVAREQTTAKRVFMLAAEFAKHFDERTPVRLLIAESDTPFTLLVALYYARLFGVERYVEISPLFETPEGLHHGDRVISEVLDNPHFVDYLRLHGRFCVQIGFSDSGRYIGQPAATLAIERFKLRLVRLWKQRGLGDIQLALFDTFGESIGRGAHPRSLEDRFLYTHSPEVRAQLEALAAPHKHEVSFQGGEGYLWFASTDTALGVVSRLLATRLAPPRRDADPLYERSGWALDFFLTLQDFQRRLTQHRGYLALVNALGRNLLYPSGSRPARRQSTTGQPAGIESIADLRAIPNNAILHQVGYLVNSCAGLGRAADQSVDTFAAVLERSDRLERILSLASAARARSDIAMLEAYVQLASAGYWLDRSTQSLDRDWNRRLRRVSRVVEATFDQDDMASFVRTLKQDAAMLDDALGERHVEGAWSSADALAQLHVLRLALIQFVYLKAMEVPRFSPRTEVTLTALIERLLRLDVRDTVAMLRDIFPVSVAMDDTDVYAEQDTYAQTERSGYAVEHEQVFDPIERAYGLILEISALIALHVGAYG